MVHSFENDDFLIEALKKGNEKAYKYLYETKYKDIVHYINGLTKDYDKAEDIVQEIIFRLWKNREQIEITSSIMSYLYKASYYLFINEYKIDKRKENLSEKIQKKVVFELIESYEEQNQLKMKFIIQIIEKLPPKRKKIFIMNKTEGLTYEEIASYLEISVKTVESQMSKALKEIRLQVKDTTFTKAMKFIFFFIGF